MKKVFLCLIFIFTFSFIDIYAKEYNIEDITKYIDNYYNENSKSLAGFSIDFFNNNESLIKSNYGYSKLKSNIIVDQNMVYEWGNLSEILILISAMQLKEQGVLDFNTNIKEYLPYNFTKELKYDKTITMYHLINHTSGFENVILGTETSNKNNIMDLNKFLLIYEPNQIHTPGEYVNYNSYDSALAAYVIESLTDEPFYSYVKNNILKPLNMNETGIKYDLSDNSYAYDQYRKQNRYSSSLKKVDIDYLTAYPSGSVVSSINDLEILAKALLNKDKKIFSNKETFDELFSKTRTYGNTDEIANYLGFWKWNLDGNIVGIKGNTKGSSSILLLNLDDNNGLIIMSNKSNDNTIENISKKIYGEKKYNVDNYKGFIYKANSITNGPLKITSLLSMSYVDTSKKNNAPIKISNKIYQTIGGDYIIYNNLKTIIELCLILMMLISFIYAITRQIIMLTKKIKYKNEYVVNKSIIINCILIVLPLIFLFIEYLFLKNYNFYPTTPYAIISYLMFLLLILTIAKFLYGFIELITIRKKVLYNMLLLLPLLILIINNLYWQWYMFWLI